VVKGYVLCGGHSARMGRDKAFVEVEGTPLAERVARALVAGGVAEIALVGRSDQDLGRLGRRVVLDGAGSGSHPLVGVVAALVDAVPADAVVAPCDLPWLDGTAIAALIAGGPPAVAWDGTRVHPLLLFLPASVLPVVGAIVARGGSAHELAASFRRILVDPATVQNANRPEDLAPVVDIDRGAG
jgi:molybdenum cofactor guanylyltransferase